MTVPGWRYSVAVAMAAGLMTVVGTARAEDAGAKVSLSDGTITMTAPADWQKKTPRTNIVEYEFAAPAVDGDATDGRLTIMGAGGSVEANIDRWIGQFSQPDGSATKDVAKIEKKDLDGGATLHTVDLTGTFKDQMGPFAPATVREDYRMLGAIIVTPKNGQYFIKFYGPKRTIAANEAQFKAFLESAKIKG